jgi:hypothetical protein
MGMIIVGVFIIYCIVGLVVSMLAYKFTKKAKYSILVILFFALLPTWDLLIQKAVKEYYVTFKMEPKIYAYPERDENGKIESLGFDRGLKLPYGSYYWFKDNQKFEKYTSKYSYKVISTKIYIYYEFFNEENNNTSFFRVNINPLKYKFIDKMTSRYQIIRYKEHKYLFGLINKRIYNMIDTKQNNKVLAHAYSYGFPRTNNIARYVRNNLLMLRVGASGTVELFRVHSFNNISKTLNKLFDLNIKVYEYTIKTKEK